MLDSMSNKSELRISEEDMLLETLRMTHPKKPPHSMPKLLSSTILTRLNPDMPQSLIATHLTLPASSKNSFPRLIEELVRKLKPNPRKSRIKKLPSSD